MRNQALKSLSALAKFTGFYDDFKVLVKNYGLKWVGKSSDDLLIERLTRNNNGSDLVKWINDVKTAIPELSVFMDFVVSTGLRFEEAIQAYNLIIDLSKQNKLSEYFDRENQILEHFRFRELFIRKSKKAFISFVSENLMQQIVTHDKVSRALINHRLSRRRIKARFSDLREYYATVMTKHLKQPEIDFLQGRTSTSVFMRNYFNPVWIQDLKNRALEGTSESMNGMLS